VDGMTKIVIPFNQKTLFRTAVIAGVLFIAFLALPVSGKPIQPVLWFGALAAFGILLRVSYYIFSNKPAVILDERGIFDRSTTMLGAGMMEWDEIREFRLYKYGSVLILGIVPVDEGKAFMRHNFFKRFYLRYMKGLGYAPYNISQPAVEMPLADILKKIKDTGRFTGLITGLMD
jgi:hypothetical protein